MCIFHRQAIRNGEARYKDAQDVGKSGAHLSSKTHAVPPGLRFDRLYPALTCWAFLYRASGAPESYVWTSRSASYFLHRGGDCLLRGSSGQQALKFDLRRQNRKSAEEWQK